MTDFYPKLLRKSCLHPVSRLLSSFFKCEKRHLGFDDVDKLR